MLNARVAKKSDPVKKFGLLLKKLKLERQLTQEGLAAELEVDRAYISQLERGLRNPGLITLIQLAEVFEGRVTFVEHDLGA